MRQLNPSSRNGAIMFSNQADISWSPKKSITFKIQFERYQDIKAKLCAVTFYKPIYIILGWRKKTQTCIYRLKVFLFYFIPYLTFLSFCVSYILWFDRDAFRIQRYLINLYLPDFICFVKNALFGAYVWLKMIILLNLISNSK